MNAAGKSILASVTDWFASVGEVLRNALALLPVGDGGQESGPGTDRDFDGWVANDPMVTMNPASRYGDDATAFLAGPDAEHRALGDNGD